ncbi:hypothetical protein [Longimycelium tulufanense]|uniref:hypothetical protein n=1 Tax=Longimycelium tulufanense TaxID=907463 RepID=UPI0016699F1E|nr:hypothetical protein [Longimycelium tulufanense]
MSKRPNTHRSATAGNTIKRAVGIGLGVILAGLITLIIIGSLVDQPTTPTPDTSTAAAPPSANTQGEINRMQSTHAELGRYLDQCTNGRRPSCQHAVDMAELLLQQLSNGSPAARDAMATDGVTTDTVTQQRDRARTLAGR